MQNYTVSEPHQIVEADQQSTLHYVIKPGPNTEARDYYLTLNIRYEDEDGSKYQQNVFNETITFSEVDGVDFRQIFPIAVVVGIIVLIGYLVMGQFTSSKVRHAVTLDVLGPSENRRRVSGITLLFITNRLFQSACCAKTADDLFFPIGTYLSKYRALREWRERYRNCLVLCRDVRERLQKKRSSAPVAKSYNATPGDLSDFLPAQPQVGWFRCSCALSASPPCHLCCTRACLPNGYRIPPDTVCQAAR